jgi:hypothetical protein
MHSTLRNAYCQFSIATPLLKLYTYYFLLVKINHKSKKTFIVLFI